MANRFDAIINELKNNGVIFTAGLTNTEIQACENCYRIHFPLPLKELYLTALPVSHDFYNWRNLNKDYIHYIQKQLNWPLEGILFDIGK